MNSKEVWKDIPGYEGRYAVSNYGRVASYPKKTFKGTRVIKPFINKRGYCTLTLVDGEGRPHSMRVHVLVLSAFRPVDKKHGYDREYTIDHINGNKSDNRLENLEWVSQSENQIRAVETGLQKTDGIRVIRLDDGKIYKSYAEAARDLGTDANCKIAMVCKGFRSHYRGFHYANYDDFVNGTIPEYKGTCKKGVAKSLWR